MVTVTHDFTQKSGAICKLLPYEWNGKKMSYCYTSFQGKWVKLYYDAYFINVTLLSYIHINLEGTFNEKNVQYPSPFIFLLGR